MRILFTVVGRNERPLNRTIELPVPPRVGDEVQYGQEDNGDYENYVVRTIVWMPDEPDYDVYVVLA